MKIKLGLSTGIKVGSIGLSRGDGASDTTRPSVAITCAQTGPTATTPLNFTFTFSEDVTGFAVGDITAAVPSGTVTKSGFTAVSAAIYTCNLAPSVTGMVTVDVADGVCADASGNTNTAATQFTISFIVYALQDEFTTDDDAPVTSPRTAEPGPGTITITDTGNKVSISGGLMVVGLGTGSNDPRAYSGNLTRASGLVYKTRIAKTQAAADRRCYVAIPGTGDTQETSYTLSLGGNGNDIVLARAGGISTGISYATNVYATYYLVLRSTGCFSILDDKLVWVSNVGAGATPQAGYFSGGANRVGYSLEYMRVSQLAAPYNADFGLATGYTASPASGASLTHTADCIVNFKWTIATSEVLEMDVRRTDADNRWIVRCSQADVTNKLIERNSSTETERASASATNTGNGLVYTVQALAVGNTISAYLESAGNDLRGAVSYTSATFNNTATTAMVSGFSTGVNFATYPRTLTGAALAALQAI